MIFAGILAGGTGVRTNRDIPKQFIPINGKPIIYYPLKQFVSLDNIGKIIISCHKLYINMVEDMIDKYVLNDKIFVIEGGNTRHKSLINIIASIKQMKYESDDKILFHEAARPLIDTDIIMNHINFLDHYQATNTLFRSVDTIMISKSGDFIDNIPEKKTIYHGQTPQGYRLGKLMDVLENDITNDDIVNEVDLCAIYLRHNRKIKIVKGSEKLFKVTYPTDLRLVQYYLDTL